jgi:ankyrin repeat protein
MPGPRAHFVGTMYGAGDEYGRLELIDVAHIVAGVGFRHEADALLPCGRAFWRCEMLRAALSKHGAGPSRRTRLHCASARADVPRMRELLKAGALPDQRDACDEQIGSLHHAAISEAPAAPEAVALLVAKGANIELTDIEYGATPLHWAS